ncbi:MAG: polyphosphate kinase 2 family protein [Ignavibacteria bacterium]|nr:polyphosphate kinase 2 family protein [Ignavibacteria bacterium]
MASAEDILNEIDNEVKNCMVKEGSKVRLKDFSTKYEGDILDKELAQDVLERGRERLAEFQDKLYAHDQYNVLIVLQAMDAAGKDGVIKHIMSGLNPSGVRVASFKAPTKTELDHDYFWRHYLALPARGEIGIFNRSHYENVLITRVHPEYLLNENLPGIEKVEDADEKFWKDRFRQINRFEKNLSENGTIILKFFLNVSKKEQKKRFLERIDDKKKNWKFSAADVKERLYWDEYQKAFEEMIEETTKDHAPWFVIPSDNKWWGRLLIAMIIYRMFEKMNFSYPEATPEQLAALQKAKEQLLSEED